MEIIKLLFGPLVTLIVGGLAIVLYLTQRRDTKRDAAKIVIQEIRRAEQIISDYKETGSYQFSKKIIATNSWTKNIHFFVGQLTSDELDKISDLYSTGEYLDNLISEVSQITLKHEIDSAKVIQQNIVTPISDQQPRILLPGLLPVWKTRFDYISLKIEPIYHSTIVGKLKKIAKIS